MNMVPLKKYEKYINNNEILTKCQKKIFIEYKKILNTSYVEQLSNNQLVTLVNNINKNDYISYETKLKMIFLKFFNREFTNKLYSVISRNPKMKDTEIMSYIMSRYKYSKKDFHSQKSLSLKICSEWTFAIQIIVHYYKRIMKKMNGKYNPSKIKYIDIGCGGGNKTKKIGNELELSHDNIFGADIKTWGPYLQTELVHKFNFIDVDNDKIYANDNTFDIATCILMLHHVKNLDKLIQDIKRVLKPGGILIIVEHNIYDDYDHLMLDVLHMLYEHIVDKNKQYLKHPQYAAYYNWIEWNYIMKKHEFIFVKNNVLFTKINDQTRYDNIFYSFFINEK